LLTASIKRQIWTLDKDLPVFDVQTMQDVLDDNLGQRRFDSYLMSIFGGLAVVLACVGIYGVLATTVVQQTREIGVRMALGASRGDVLKMIMGQGLRWVSIGLLVGLTAGFLVTRMLASLLFGVGPTNPITYMAVSAVMLAVAALACYLPAVRAIRIDPMRALRYE